MKKVCSVLIKPSYNEYAIEKTKMFLLLHAMSPPVGFANKFDIIYKPDIYEFRSDGLFKKEGKPINGDFPETEIPISDLSQILMGSHIIMTTFEN